MDNILVTGGAGFIGSHLCEYLLSKGNRVICIDNFCDFYDPAAKQKNISTSQKHPFFSLHKADIRDRNAIERIFSENHIDMVIHLAAMAGVRPSIMNPQLYADVNIMGTLSLLQACQSHGIKRFIFASSSSVYGNNPDLPFCETDNVDNPISPYAATKKAGELLCYNWHHLYDIDMICLRFFTVYGPRQRPDLAIHKFYSLISAGKPIGIYGDGKSSRDYTFIADIIQGIVLSIEYLKSHSGYEIINLGESQTQDLLYMIRCLENAMGQKAVLEQHPAQAGDVYITYADINKAKKLLGYRPKTDFESGIKVFVNWANAHKT